MSGTPPIRNHGFIRAQELSRMLAVHRTTLWRWVRDGHLPRPVQLGPNTVAWDSGEIDTWPAARAVEEKVSSA